MNKLEVVTLSKKGITDFAKERNNLLAKAAGEWVFFLDTDEKITPQLQKEIANLDVGDYDGFVVLRKNYFCGQFVGEDRLVRLGRKNAGKWQRRVHETWNIHGKIGELSSPIIHNTAEGVFGYLEKINSYSTLHAGANKEEGKTASLLKITLYPKMKFFMTLFKSHSLVFSFMQSFHSFLAWSKLWFIQRKN